MLIEIETALTCTDGPSADTSHGLPPLQTDEPTSAQEVKQFVPPTKDSIMAERARVAEAAPAKRPMRLIEVIANDRLGGKGTQLRAVQAALIYSLSNCANDLSFLDSFCSSCQVQVSMNYLSSCCRPSLV